MPRHRPVADPRITGGLSVAVAMGVMNVSTYGYTILAARVLGPQSYGAFAALMGLLLVVLVASLTLQATAARRIAAAPHHVHHIESKILRVGVQASLGLTAVCLLAAPLINSVLRLDSLATAVVTALAAGPLTMMGAQAGILQGERRWVPLALIYVAAGVPRLVIGTLALLWRPDELGAMLGVAVAALVPVIVGAWTVRNPRRVPEQDPLAGSQEHTTRALWHEMGHNSNALLAFFALSNADILVARNVMDSHQAGLYAGGLILVKAVLFLPQFVVVLAFPSMASSATGSRSALRASMAVVTALGALVALGSAVLADLAVIFVGGEQYSALRDRLWLFAVLGTVLALLQLVIYNLVARQSRRTIILVWAALVVLLLVGRLADTFEELLVLVLCVDSALLALLLVLNAISGRRGRDGRSGSVRRGVPAPTGADRDVEVHGEVRG